MAFVAIDWPSNLQTRAEREARSKGLYEAVQADLEASHPGEYVIFHAVTGEHLVDDKAAALYGKADEKWGKDAPTLCMRVRSRT